MSGFDEWLDNQDVDLAEPIIDALKTALEAAYNAGMERAAKIASKSRVSATGGLVAEAIRKEISNE